MSTTFKFVYFLFGLLMIAACDSNEPPSENLGEQTCECYRKKHNANNVNYDASLSLDVAFWKSKFKQLKAINRASMNDLLSAYENGDIIPGKDSSEMLNHKNNVKSYLLEDCLYKLSTIDRKLQAYLDLGDEGLYQPWEFDKESWEIRLKAHKANLKKLNDEEWMTPHYLNIAQYLYEDYLRMLAFEKSKAELLKIENEKISQQAVQEEYEKLHPPPPPPPPNIMIATPPLDEEEKEATEYSDPVIVPPPNR
jgi:hypothetical protein